MKKKSRLQSSRLVFAGINNVKSPEEAQIVAVGRLHSASEKNLEMLPAQYVRSDNVEFGVVFFLDAESGKNIVDEAVKLNRILGGGIHSVETNDYGKISYCFHTVCRGKLETVAEIWKNKAVSPLGFIDCIIHQSSENACYITGTIDRRFLVNEADSDNGMSLWRQKINVLCKSLGCVYYPRFVETRQNSFD